MNQVIKVWDLPTRLFHWALVLSVFYAWFAVEILEDMQQHFYAGYAVLVLISFRIIWGLIGSEASLFSSFLVSPLKALGYARSLGKSSRPHLSHNPTGGWSVVAMLVFFGAQAVLGLFSTDDYFYGPLSGLISDELRGRLTELHLLNVNILYGLIALHVVAISYYQFIADQPLIGSMIHGKKPGEPQSKLAKTSPWWALFVLLITIAAVYWLATAFVDLIPQEEFSYY